MVSVLFNEPKLLKYFTSFKSSAGTKRFSALQRAEIAEIHIICIKYRHCYLSFSALQRAEIAEILPGSDQVKALAHRFSALQRAEIAEIFRSIVDVQAEQIVSVLFNEPKLLKFTCLIVNLTTLIVSVLFNEPKLLK